MGQPELTHQHSLEPDPASKAYSKLSLRQLNQTQQALLYLTALGLAELFVAIWDPRAGMFLHGVILMALFIQATMFTRGLWQKFLLALAIAPLVRLLSLTMPLPEFPFVYWYFIVGAPLFIAAYLVIRYAKLSRSMVGLTTKKPVIQIVVGMTGLALGLIEYFILRPDPLAEELHWRFLWLPALILLIFTGFLEELIFRGVMQYTAIRRFGRFGIVFIAAVFAVLHFGYRSLIDVVFVFAVALYFAYVVHRTGSILGVTLAHGLTNIGLFLIFPFMLARPVQQLPAPQDILAPPPQLSATPIIITTRTPTPTFTPSPTPYLVTPTATLTSTAVPTNTPLPSKPTSPTDTSCKPRSDWVLYTIQFGDSWESLSQRYELSVSQLQQANCFDNNVDISIGDQIYVPYMLFFPTTPPASTIVINRTATITSLPSPTLVAPTTTTVFATPTIAPPESPSTLDQPTATQPLATIAPPAATQSLPSSVPPTATQTVPTDIPSTPMNTISVPTDLPVPTPAPP